MSGLFDVVATKGRAQNPRQQPAFLNAMDRLKAAVSTPSKSKTRQPEIEPTSAVPLPDPDDPVLRERKRRALARKGSETILGGGTGEPLGGN